MPNDTPDWARAAAGPSGAQVTRVWRARLAAPSTGAWASMVSVSGGSMPHVGNQLFAAQWAVAAIIGAGTGTDCLVQIGFGPLGHPGGPPVLIVGAEIAIPDTTHVQVSRGQLVLPQPMDLAAFFGGGAFTGQPEEGQVFVDIGGAGTIASLDATLLAISLV